MLKAPAVAVLTMPVRTVGGALTNSETKGRRAMTKHCKRVGCYQLGPRSVELFGIPDNDDGGQFDLSPKSGIAEIIVGLKPSWAQVTKWVLHEAFEAAATDCGCRFVPAPDYSGEIGGYAFAMSHAQFSEVAARTSMFMTDAWPELAAAYNRLHPKRGKR